jgi:hypothetical protein
MCDVERLREETIVLYPSLITKGERRMNIEETHVQCPGCQGWFPELPHDDGELSFCGGCAEGDRLQAIVDKLRADLKTAIEAAQMRKIQAIVDKLPKDAEGNPVAITGDTVLYHPDRDGPCDELELDENGYRAGWYWSSGGYSTYGGYAVEECYQTEAAAQAAKEGD